MNPTPPPEDRASQARGRETIRRLLQAAREALAEVSWADLTIDNVTDRAGLSHGTFYQWFSDRRDLLMALIDEAATAIDQTGELTPDLRHPGGRQELHSWVRLTLRTMERHEVVLRAALAADPNWDWRTITKGVEARLADRIIEARGLDITHPAEQAAWAFGAMLVGVTTGSAPSNSLVVVVDDVLRFLTGMREVDEVGHLFSDDEPDRLDDAS